MEEVKSKKPVLFILLGIVAVGALLIFILIAASPTTFDYYERKDGTYDAEISTLNMFSKKVTVPAEHKGKKVTSFLMNEPTGSLDKVNTIILSEGIEEVNINRLDFYPDLEKIELPSTIKYVYGSLVSDVEVVFENNAYVELVSGCFIDKQTKTVTGAKNYAEIPDGVKVIGTRAFQGLKLKTIKIPSSVEEIESYAFTMVSVEQPVEITLSKNIKYVAAGAFHAPITISKLTISTSGPLDNTMFGDVNNGATINTIFLDTKPLITFGLIVYDSKENYKGGEQFHISGDKNAKALKYLYVNESVTGIDKMMLGTVESDVSGYKKYDFAKVLDPKGYTIISYVKKAG